MEGQAEITGNTLIRARGGGFKQKEVQAKLEHDETRNGVAVFIFATSERYLHSYRVQRHLHYLRKRMHSSTSQTLRKVHDVSWLLYTADKHRMRRGRGLAGAKTNIAHA